MVPFLKKTLSFIFLSVVLTTTISFLSEYIVRVNSDFKIDENIESIVVGHSHSACAFNDSIIKNFKNLSSSGESYFYTYVKLKECLKQNPSIKTVFIEFSNNQIIDEMDNWIWGDMYITARYPIYSPFFSLKDKAFLLTKNFSSFRNAYALSIKSNIERITSSNFKFSDLGGYRSSNDQKVDSILANKNADTTKNYSLNVSQSNILYLAEMVNLCKKCNKRVILVRSPMHPNYGGYVNENQYQLIMKKSFSKIEYIDCSKFPLTNDEFGDLEHLNSRGSKRFSQWFQRNVIEKISKQAY